MSDWITEQFQENRAYLRNVARRMLGSDNDADDALQEAWIRLTQSEAEKIENLRGWLTTVVSRICLDLLRSRKLRQGESLEEEIQPSSDDDALGNPEEDLLLADSLGPALLVVLEHLAPSERVTLVLHDVFDLPYHEIAPIIGRSEAATRQIASRARRRIRGVKGATEDERVKQEIVQAFLTASRQGDFTALLQLLDPEVVLEADDAAVRISAMRLARGAPQFEPRMTGAKTIAELFRGKAKALRLALIDDSAGATFMINQIPLVALEFVVRNGRISHVGVIMDRESLAKRKITMIEEAR